MVIGQAFSGAYKQFLRSSGVSDEHLEQAEYAHILNAQSVPQLEVESLSDRNKIKKVWTKILCHFKMFCNRDVKKSGVTQLFLGLSLLAVGVAI